MKESNVYFASDYHLGHTNILKYDPRPFKDVHHMNRTIIDNHNSVVRPNDDFFFLGDFAFSKDFRQVESWLDELNGNLHFIEGNHDHSKTRKLYQKYGTFLGGLADITVNNQQIILCHYAMRVWNRSHHGSWHLYGHSHHSLPDDPHSRSFDVGINGAGYNYTPLSFNQVAKIMSKKQWKPIDHHTGER